LGVPVRKSGEGINKTGEIVDLGAQFDLIQKSGAWYSYNGAKIAQGRDAAKQFLNDNPEMALELENKIKERLASGGNVAPAAAKGRAVAADLDDDDDA
jgi:recombination protein RecA